MNEQEKERQIYCAECFKSLNKETIAKNKNKNKPNNTKLKSTRGFHG